MVYNRFNIIKKSSLKDPLKKYNADVEDLFPINKEKISKGLNVKRLFADYIKTEFNLEVDETIYDIAKYYFESLRYERFIEIENAIYIMLLFSEFDNYLFKCFKYILSKKPSILNDQTITIKELIERKGNIDLILDELAEKQALQKLHLELLLDDIIEKKIHNRFYQNYKGVFSFAKKKLGLDIDIHKEHMMMLDFFKQIRNLYSHGDGKVNSIFINKIRKIGFKTENYKLGKKINLTDEDIADFNSILISALGRFDNAFVKSYPEIITERE